MTLWRQRINVVTILLNNASEPYGSGNYILLSDGLQFFLPHMAAAITFCCSSIACWASTAHPLGKAVLQRKGAGHSSMYAAATYIEEPLSSLCSTTSLFDPGQGYVNFADNDSKRLEDIHRKNTISDIEKCVGKTVQSITFTDY